jgi:hypothetical protein
LSANHAPHDFETVPDGDARTSRQKRRRAAPSPTYINGALEMASDLRELIALSLLAGFGFGLALARGDLLFVAVFGLASALAIMEAMRRFREDRH